MINTKCPICKKGSGFTTCCGYDKETGEKVVTFWDLIAGLFRKLIK